ncbi:MAG TPA: MFS transporter, partial [Armatimonadota bacterium]|nr:MFS transporter [Armatimonadota bacterium]
MAIELPQHPVFTRAQALLSTQGRRRMAVVALTTAFFSLFTVGTEVVLPLWATTELGLTASDWADLRALRIIGILAGIIILGPFSDRFGQRLLGALSMLGVAVIMVALCCGPERTIYFIMPVFGGLVSTVFLNMNTLTQAISAARQGLANTIYRGVATAAGIAAPVVATWLSLVWGGYRPVFLVFAAALVVAAAILWFYPKEHVPPPLGSVKAELARLANTYLSGLRERPLVTFVFLSQLWSNLMAGVGTFAAIYFTRELGQTHQQFGQLSAVAGVAALLGTLAAGFVLDRVSLRVLHVGVGLAAAFSAILIGLLPWLPTAVIGLVLFVPLTTLLIAPTSMWVSRAAGQCTQTAAFSLHKSAAAGLLTLSTLV